MTGAILLVGHFLMCIALLVGLYPDPESLKEPKKSIWIKLYNRKVSLLLIFSLALIHFFVSGFSFLSTHEYLSRSADFYLTFEGMILGSFIHSNYIHLFSNTAIIILVSHFEEMADSIQYLTVLGISILASSISIWPLFYQIPSVGISGGCFGLIVGFLIYVSREEKRNILYTAMAISALILYSALRTSTQENYIGNTDHFAHFMGAVSVLLFYKFKNKTH